MSTKDDISALLKNRQNIPASNFVSDNIAMDDNSVIDITNDIMETTETSTDRVGLLKLYFDKVNSAIKDIVTAIGRLITPSNDDPIKTVIMEETEAEKRKELIKIDRKNKSMLSRFLNKMSTPKTKVSASLVGVTAGILASLYFSNKEKADTMIENYMKDIKDYWNNHDFSNMLSDIVNNITEAIYNSLPDFIKNDMPAPAQSQTTVNTGTISKAIDNNISSTLNGDGIKVGGSMLTPELMENYNEASSITGINAADLAAIGRQESNYRANVQGPSTRYGTAKGMHQLLDSTYEELYNKYGDKYDLEDDIYNTRTNTILGSLYYKEQLDRYEGDRDKALAAYNWGPGNVNKAISRYGDSWKQHLPEETEKYIKLNNKWADEISANMIKEEQKVALATQTIIDSPSTDIAKTAISNKYVNSINSENNNPESVSAVINSQNTAGVTNNTYSTDNILNTIDKTVNRETQIISSSLYNLNRRSI